MNQIDETDQIDRAVFYGFEEGVVFRFGLSGPIVGLPSWS
jgi:hypothetical protein